MEQLVYEEVKARISNFLNDRDKVFCFIAAASGTGKTVILKRYCEEMKAALYFKLPFTVLKSPKSILLGILQFLDVPVISRCQSEEQLLQVMEFVLRSRRITHLAIDDIHDLDGFSRPLELFDLLESLSKETNVKFVFAGTSIPELSESVKAGCDILKAV